MRGYATMIKVLFVCHGNICRSTMAESVFTYLATQAGLASHFEINVRNGQTTKFRDAKAGFK